MERLALRWGEILMALLLTLGALAILQVIDDLCGKPRQLEQAAFESKEHLSRLGRDLVVLKAEWQLKVECHAEQSLELERLLIELKRSKQPVSSPLDPQAVAKRSALQVEVEVRQKWVSRLKEGFESQEMKLLAAEEAISAARKRAGKALQAEQENEDRRKRREEAAWSMPLIALLYLVAFLGFHRPAGCRLTPNPGKVLCFSIMLLGLILVTNRFGYPALAIGATFTAFTYLALYRPPLKEEQL